MFSVQHITTGLNQPLFLTGLNDATGRVFVLEKTGDIKILDPSTGASTTFLSLAGTISTDFERGLLGMALAPDFA